MNKSSRNGQVKRRKRERTLRQAAWLGFAATLIAGFALFLLLFFRNPSDLNNFWRVATSDQAGILGQSEMVAKFQRSIVNMELVATPLALFIGGLVLGKRAPKYASKRVASFAAAKMGGLTMLISLVVEWSSTLALQHGHLIPGQVDGILVAVQSGLIAAWTLTCALGGLIGAWWRDKIPAGGLEPPSTAKVTTVQEGT